MKSFCINNNCAEAVRWKFRRPFNLRHHVRAPSVHAIKTWVDNFDATGSAFKNMLLDANRTVPSLKKVEAVSRYYAV